MSWIYLSHVLRENTPLYGGSGKVTLERLRKISTGDHCNSSYLSTPAHAGTHIDAPYHFNQQGQSLEDYVPDFWRVSFPWLMEIACAPAEIIDLKKCGEALNDIPEACDGLFLKTGAEVWREHSPEIYMNRGPALAVEVVTWLRQHRRLKFFGLDCISIGSVQHREIGRQAHQEFFKTENFESSPVLLVEDMKLSQLERSPKTLWIVPMLYEQADGSPATVLAEIIE